MRRRLATGVLASAAVLGVSLSACASDDDAAAGSRRTVEITAREFSFSGDPGTIVAGDEVEFVMTNEGTLVHELQVLSPAGTRLGTTGDVAPGERATVTVTFDDAGVHRLICDVDDHMSLGQTASIVVDDAG